MGDRYQHMKVVPENLDETKPIEPERLVRDRQTGEAINEKEAVRRVKAYIRSIAVQTNFMDVVKQCLDRWNLREDEIVETVYETNYNMRLNRATKFAPIAAAETLGTAAPAGNYQAKLAWAQGVLAGAAPTNEHRQAMMDWIVAGYQVLSAEDAMALIVYNLGPWYVAPPPPPPEPEPAVPVEPPAEPPAEPPVEPVVPPEVP